MRIGPCLPCSYRRITAIVLLATSGIALVPARAEAGALLIPAWSYARGNVQIHADPQKFADVAPVVASGDKQPWGSMVEYDVDIPVTGKYTLQICYAAAEARPMVLYLDDVDMGKCCDVITLSKETADRPAEPTFNSSGAQWVGFHKQKLYTSNRRQLHEFQLAKGKHTFKLVRGGPLPHLVALRLDTTEGFPEDRKEPKYEARDIESVAAAHRGSILSGRVGDPIRELPIAGSPVVNAAGTLTIPAWTFDRGTAEVYASPDHHADAGPMVGGMMDGSEIGTVEYDIDFPADGQYTFKLSYASAEARPVEVSLDGRKLGNCCMGVTYGTAAYETPVRFSSNSSSALWRREGIRKDGQQLWFDVKKGKHTLKFTRRGPLPNMMTLLVHSSSAFPEGWKQPARKMRHFDRVPARERAAFLSPNAVNVAALRAAIGDTMKTHDSQYPDGQKYLEQLAKLEAKQAATTDEAREKVEDELTALRLRAMAAHPRLNFDAILFLTRKGGEYGTTYNDHNANQTGGNLCVLSPVSPEGTVTKLLPELDGGLFDRFDLSFDATKVVFSYKKENEGFRIYEFAIDPATAKRVPGSLRQLTFTCDDEAQALKCNAEQGRSRDCGFNDMDPCYLPDGRIMFTSTRSMRNVFCAPSTVTTLYVMDADGKNMQCISASPINETSPAVMDDGRVIYTRWEYVDKGLGNGQSLWVIRPDGSGSDHVFKNNTVLPAGMSNARSIPGSRKIVTIGGSHGSTAVGSVILVDTRKSRRGTEAMECITPEIGYPCMSWPIRKFGFFTDPYPFSEKFFLASHKPGAPSRNIHRQYGLYALDAWGNRARLCSDDELNCYQPVPLVPRPKPPKLAPLAAKQRVNSGLNAAGVKPLGTMFLQDVYQGLTGVERGRVKYLRVMGVLNWPWNEKGIFKVGLNVDVHRKKVYGVVNVHDDGSAYFSVPAEENVFFQALDENYMALQHMPTFVNLMPGERRSCIGCHEPRRNAPPISGKRPMALEVPPQLIVPQPGDKGPRMVDYAADVQPVFDRNCVACHTGKNAKGRMDLTGMPTGMWNKSYETLIGSGLVRFRDGRCGRAGFLAVPPMTHGSFPSKLSHQIREAPCNENLSREDFIKIVTWLDANVPYYGTYRGNRDLQDKDHPNFRALPLAGK